MREQTIVSIQDLRFATLYCRDCNTRVTLDLDAEFKPESDRPPFEAPKECPRCANRFDSAVPEAINNIRKGWKALSRLDNAVTFESAVPAPASPK